MGGIVVDPYIVGATFQEILLDGSPGQISSPSNENGRFDFSAPLSQGSVITMKDQGIHNGTAYVGNLKAQAHHRNNFV